MKRLTVLLLVLAFAVSMTAAALAEDACKGYVYIRLEGSQMFKVFKLAASSEESYRIPIQQLTSDGTVVENVVLITDEGFCMESSTCEGHDCVDMGTVTLENKNMRVLGGAVCCLPHQIFIELWTPEEFNEWYADYLRQLGQ